MTEGAKPSATVFTNAEIFLIVSFEAERTKLALALVGLSFIGIMRFVVKKFAHQALSGRMIADINL